MQGLRQDVSLLLSEGHAQARHYPVAMAWAEARIVRQRHSLRMVAEAVTMQAVVASCLSKEGGQHLAELLKDLSADG